MNTNKFPLFIPPPLESRVHIHIDESPEAFNDTTVHGPVPVASIDTSQGSFAQVSESPDDNFVVDIIQYETRKAYLPDCVTSYFTREQRMDHRGNALAIHHFDGTTDHALRIGEIATQRRQQKLNVGYNLPSRKHPKSLGHRDFRTAVPSSRDQAMSFDVQNKNKLWETAYYNEHLQCRLPLPIKSIFSIQRNGQRKVTFVPVDDDNNIIMKGFKHPRPGKCFKTLKSIHIDKQMRKYRNLHRVLFTDTIDGRVTIVATPTTKHTHNLRKRTKTRCLTNGNLSSRVISP